MRLRHCDYEDITFPSWKWLYGHLFLEELFRESYYSFVFASEVTSDMLMRSFFTVRNCGYHYKVTKNRIALPRVRSTFYLEVLSSQIITIVDRLPGLNVDCHDWMKEGF